MSFSSVRYNVDSLKTDGVVLDKDESGHSRLFPPAVSDWEVVVYSHLRTRSSRMVLRALAEHGRLSNWQLSEITGYAKSTLSESIRRLLEAGLLTNAFGLDGRLAYQIKEPERVLPILHSANHKLLEVATDRFIQLWDF